MRNPELTSSCRQCRSRVARFVAAALVLLVAGGWLAKGSGLKTWIKWHVLGRAPHEYVAGLNSLAMRVHLSTDPMVQFERVALPPTAGTAYTCVRFGPDGKFYAGS